MDKPLTRAQRLLFVSYAEQAENLLRKVDQQRLTPELYTPSDITYTAFLYSQLMDKVYELETNTGHKLNEKYERFKYSNII